MLDWDKLRIFLCVASHKKIADAGEQLNLHPSTVGRHIQDLEQMLNTKLFHRHKTGLALTGQGEILLDSVRNMNNTLDKSLGEMSEALDSISGTLRLHSTIAIGTAFISSLMFNIINSHPQLRIKMILNDKDVDLLRSEADVSLRLHQSKEMDLIERKIFTFRPYLFASKGYIDRFGSPQNAEDLANHKLIAFGDESIKPFSGINWFLNYNLKKSLVPVMTVNNITAIYRAINSNIGIGSLPHFVIPNHVTLLKVLPELSGPEVSMYFVYPPHLRGSKKLKMLWDVLLPYSKELEQIKS